MNPNARRFFDPLFALSALGLCGGLLTGCILDFDGLATGDTGSGAGGSGAENGGGTAGSGGNGAAGSTLCSDACTDGTCEPLQPLMGAVDPYFRVTGSGGAIWFGDPIANEVVRLDADGVTAFDAGIGPYATTLNADYLFYSGQGQGIFRCTRDDCTTRVELVPSIADSNARQLVADDTQLFWIVGPDISEGKVFRCDIDACNPELIASDQPRPHSLATDDQFVYWTVHGTGGPADGSLQRAPKAGGAVVSYRDGLVGPSGIAVTESDVVFSQGTLDGDIWRCQKGADQCGEPELVTDGPTLADSPIHSPASVTVVGDMVYWTNDGDATVMGCPLSGCSDAMGGAPQVLANDVANPRGIVFAGGCLAWIAADGVYGTPPP